MDAMRPAVPLANLGRLRCISSRFSLLARLGRYKYMNLNFLVSTPADTMKYRRNILQHKLFAVFFGTDRMPLLSSFQLWALGRFISGTSKLWSGRSWRLMSCMAENKGPASQVSKPMRLDSHLDLCRSNCWILVPVLQGLSRATLSMAVLCLWFDFD